MANFEIDKLSVFFPSYNEEGNIENTVTKAKKVLEKTAKEWELIIVNDGQSKHLIFMHYQKGN